MYRKLITNITIVNGVIIGDWYDISYSTLVVSLIGVNYFIKNILIALN
jgi:hypothetical protein